MEPNLIIIIWHVWSPPTRPKPIAEKLDHFKHTHTNFSRRSCGCQLRRLFRSLIPARLRRRQWPGRLILPRWRAGRGSSSSDPPASASGLFSPVTILIWLIHELFGLCSLSYSWIFCIFFNFSILKVVAFVCANADLVVWFGSSWPIPRHLHCRWGLGNCLIVWKNFTKIDMLKEFYFIFCGDHCELMWSLSWWGLRRSRLLLCSVVHCF